MEWKKIVFILLYDVSIILILKLENDNMRIEFFLKKIFKYLIKF